MSDANWQPTEGKRAWYGDRNCDVVRVYKGGTATVTFWGSGLMENRLVTRRGVRLDQLSEPRRILGINEETGRPMYAEPSSPCDLCGQSDTDCADRLSRGRSCA